MKKLVMSMLLFTGIVFFTQNITADVNPIAHPIGSPTSQPQAYTITWQEPNNNQKNCPKTETSCNYAFYLDSPGVRIVYVTGYYNKPVQIPYGATGVTIAPNIPGMRFNSSKNPSSILQNTDNYISILNSSIKSPNSKPFLNFDMAVITSTPRGSIC